MDSGSDIQAELTNPDADRTFGYTSAPHPANSRQRRISVIVPTYNESENIPILIERLEVVLGERPFEVIVVDDDSPDETWKVVGALAEEKDHVRLLHRIDKRGLSSAVFDGMTAASGSVYVVMDADLQHDESIIPQLVEPIFDQRAAITVASREVEGGGYGDFAPTRRLISWTGATIARRLLKVRASDPMSGFFAVSSARFHTVKRNVNPRGFKILLQFLARRPRPEVIEVGYTFRNRMHGQTKLTSSVLIGYLLTVLELTIGRLISARFSAYVMVGAVGLLVRVLVSQLTERTVGMATFADQFVSGPTVGTVLAIEASVLSNYWGNNVFTFSPFRHRGRDILGGLLRFHLVSAHSLVVSTGVIAILTRNTQETLFATWPQVPLVSFASAIVVATLGNYYLNSILTWRAGS